MATTRSTVLSSRAMGASVGISSRCTTNLSIKLLLLLTVVLVDSQDSIELSESLCTCPTSSFFSPVRLNCTQCPLNQTTSGNGHSCVCEAGFYKVAGSGVTNYSCYRCLDNQVVSQNGLFCLECTGGTAFDPSTNQCSRCSELTEIYEDMLPSSQNAAGMRSCVRCPTGTWASSDDFSCVECGLEDCSQCNVVEGVCFSPTTEPVQGLVTATYSFYTGNFIAAVQQCTEASNTSACQLVGNLCVLQQYLRSDPACQQTLRLTALDLVQAVYYAERGAMTVLEDTEVRATLFTRNMSSLPLVVASYSLNGTFLGLADLSSQQILLCKDRPSRGASSVRVGVDYHISCSLSASELTKQAESPIFYEMFILSQASDASNSSQLLPIPVLITNYRTPQGELVNEGTNVNRWQLVRRFLLTEAVTSQPQYVQDIKLVVGFSGGGRLFLPYLGVTYSSWTPGQTSSQSVQSSYWTTYTRQLGDEAFIIVLSILAGVLLVIAVVYAALKTNGYLRRAGCFFCELKSFLYLLMEFCAASSSLLFFLLTANSFFWLVVFKGQMVLFFVLPTSQQEIVFEVLLALALAFRIFQVCHLMWTQCTVDVFFMDWERSRGVLVNRNLTSVPKGAQPDSVPTPVSIWRTYFVANEWNEIQSLRVINHRLLLVLVICFIQVVGFEHLAERDPESHVTAPVSRYVAPPSDILRFCVISLTFLIIASFMRLYLYLIYERYVGHKTHQFTDLCSVSNVSVLIMPHRLFGYYIHGRSVHGHADTNMREMNYSLHKEEEGLCGERGLESGSDLQTYEISLTDQFRTQYDTIYSPLRARWAEGGNTATTELGRGGTPAHKGRNLDSGRGLSESTIVAYEAMNQFLTQFFERSLQQMSFVVKDKLLAERILKMEFNSAIDSSIVYRDSNMNFDHVLFRGHGWTLFQLDLLVFATVDLVSKNYVLAAVITFIITWFLDYLRDAFGRRNLARKTLVDDRFLI